MARMRAKRTDTKELVPCLIGITISVITAIVLIVLMTLFISNEYIDIKLYHVIAGIIHFVSIFMGTYLTLVLLKPPYYVSAIIAGAVYVFGLCTALLFFDGLSAYSVITIIPYIAGSGIAVLLDKKGRSGRNKRRFGSRIR